MEVRREDVGMANRKPIMSFVAAFPTRQFIWITRPRAFDDSPRSQYSKWLMFVFPPQVIVLAKREVFKKNNQNARTRLGMLWTLPYQGKGARERKMPRTVPGMLIAIAMLDGWTESVDGEGDQELALELVI